MCSCPYDMDILYEVEDTFTAGSLVSPSSETLYRINLDNNAIVHQVDLHVAKLSKTILVPAPSSQTFQPTQASA